MKSDRDKGGCHLKIIKCDMQFRKSEENSD